MASATRLVVALLVCGWVQDGIPGQATPPLTPAEVAEREKDAGSDPVKIVALAEQVDAKEARRLLLKALRVYDDGNLPLAEKDPFRIRFAKAVQLVAHTPADIEAVLGPKTARALPRQVFYRRYREQWILDRPIGLGVVFDCIKGRDPQVLAVFIIPSQNP
jgi:hypothetical protein